MADVSRRGIFALLAGAAAAPMVGCGWTVPKILVQLYNENPMLSLYAHGD